MAMRGMGFGTGHVSGDMPARAPRARRSIAALVCIVLAAVGTGAGVLLGGAPGCAGDELSVEASVDRTTASLDDQIVLNITLRGHFQDKEPPAPPPMDDFEVSLQGQSQSISLINGQLDSRKTFTYLLVPKRAGDLVIRPFEIEDGGKTYHTEPIKVHVSAQGQGPAAGGGGGGADRDLFVVARVDKEHAFVNEQLIYTFYLYAAVGVSNLSYTPPQFSGFWTEKLQEGEKQYYKAVDGRRYLVIEVSTALFPTTSGKLTIDPARLRLMELTERNFSFFDRGVEKLLRSRPVEVDVQPLPSAGKPKEFDGAVGEGLDLSATLDRNEVEEGEPVNLTVRVEGTGNVRTFSKPRLPELPQFKTYDSDTKTEVRNLERVSGSRTYEIVLVPREAGEYDIPPVKLAYFDTRDDVYKIRESQPMKVVAVRTARSRQQMMASSQPPVQQDIEVLGKDIAHIRTDVPVSDALTPLYARGLFLFAAPMPFLALCAAWVLQRRRDRLASDVALARSTRARKEARKRLAASEHFLKAGRSAEFHAEVARAVLQYVGDKLNVSPSGLTHDGLRQRLDEAGASEDVRERLVQVLEHCDAARFAPGGVSAERMRNLLTEVESLVMEMEQSWNRKTARFAVVALSLLCTVLVWSSGAQAQPQAGTTAKAGAEAGAAAPGAASGSATQPAPAPEGNVHVQQEPGAEFAPPQELLSRGNAAYEAGHFAEAIEAYTSAEHLGVRNGPLYYNLGNAYYKSGSLGSAIASYRRAERLMPRDPLLRANLEFALSRREDKAVHPPMPWPIVAARAVFRWMNLNEWIVLTTGLYALACGLAFAVYLKRFRRLPVRLAFYATLGLFLLAASILLYKSHDERGVHRGVIGVDKAAVVSGPGADYTVEFWVHAGTEVTIEDRRTDWLRVSLGGRLEGWIPTQSVEPI